MCPYHMYAGFFVSFSPTHHHKSDALTVGKAGNALQKSQTGVGMYILICVYNIVYTLSLLFIFAYTACK